MSKTRVTRAEHLAAEAEALGYPEHAKLHRLDGKNEVVGDFIEWLKEHDYVLMTHWYAEKKGPLVRSNLTTQALIADYFGINERALDREKKAMLAKLREGARE